MNNITKDIFLNTSVCPTLGWLLRSGEEIEQLSVEALTLAEQFRIEQGLDIHNRARQLFPDGILVERKNLDKAIKETEELMNKLSVSTTLEATFLVDDYATKADILKRKGDGWHLFETKSGVNEKPEHIDDMAYTAMVFQKAGYKISAVSLLLISKDYRLGMKDEDLFIEIDYTDKILARSTEFQALLFDYVKSVTSAPTKPVPDLRRECKACPLFRDCVGKDIINHVLEIPRLTQTKFDQLKGLNIHCIEDIPDEFPLTDNQSRVRNCVISQQPSVNDQLKSDLSSIIWPAYYLDFETVMTAIPLYPDIAPYTQLPTQYSIHKLSDIKTIIDHREYLADSCRDCRKEFAVHLINDLEDKGSIIVYSSFEKTTMTKLGQIYPELADQLNTLIERLVDLEAIIRKNYYHPEFHGSTSIKVTLPALVSELSYSDLEIAEGDSASAAFAYLAQGKYSEENEVEDIRNKLLRYCERDTLAMVKLHEKLMGCIG
ncbi:DUF2779 domain-containing protein [Chloroflexota bacterium]